MLKKVLPCVIWVVADKVKFSCVTQEMGFICYFELMDYTYLFTDAMYGIIGFLNYLKHYPLSHLKYISNDIDDG